MEAGASEEETEHMLSSKSSDLLFRFCDGFSADELTEAACGGDSDEIELELSLGGCFSSVDSPKRQILRSSSIPAVLPSKLQPVVPLSRRCSLPSGTEEEMWRRKEIQSMKRMEAKRKMEERRAGGERFEHDLEGGSAAKLRRFNTENGRSLVMGGGTASRVFSPTISRWIAGAAPTSTSTIPLASQASIISQASSSSGGSELESRTGEPVQGFELSGFSHGSNLHLTMAGHKNRNPTPVSSSSSATPITKPVDCTSIGANGNGIAGIQIPLGKNGGASSSGMNMEEMPSVSTRGDGPNSRRIEGFLYKYKRGEEVRIVCVCHGSFLTPAEFVKHGGGGDVAHPLRHIVVNPGRASFFR